MRFDPMKMAAILLFAVLSMGHAQQSDFETTERFRTMYESLKRDIDSAKTKEQIAQASNRINGLESEFAQHGTLIGGAFYPKTFDELIADLRNQHSRAQEKASTIQTQTARIDELEARLQTLNAELDKLNTERRDLLAKLRSTTTSLAEQKELVRRLSANLEMKDRLVTAMVDSIFLPFEKNMNSLTDVQADALSKKLQKANIVTRIADIAQDNIKFLEATKLEPKDYAALVPQHEQFRNRWNGLRERVISAMNAAAANAKGKKPQLTTTEHSIAQVDQNLTEWKTKLESLLWAGVAKEFTDRNVAVQPFNDAKSFSASIRSHVNAAKANSADAQTFVNIWVQRIDKDWKTTLENESILGKTEYASLNKSVTEMPTDKFDWRIVFWGVNILAVLLVIWWFVRRKPKKVPQPMPGKTN